MFVLVEFVVIVPPFVDTENVAGRFAKALPPLIARIVTVRTSPPLAEKLCAVCADSAAVATLFRLKLTDVFAPVAEASCALMVAAPAAVGVKVPVATPSALESTLVLLSVPVPLVTANVTTVLNARLLLASVATTDNVTADGRTDASGVTVTGSSLAAGAEASAVNVADGRVPTVAKSWLVPPNDASVQLVEARPFPSVVTLAGDALPLPLVLKATAVPGTGAPVEVLTSTVGETGTAVLIKAT